MDLKRGGKLLTKYTLGYNIIYSLKIGVFRFLNNFRSMVLMASTRGLGPCSLGSSPNAPT